MNRLEEIIKNLPDNIITGSVKVIGSKIELKCSFHGFSIVYKSNFYRSKNCPICGAENGKRNINKNSIEKKYKDLIKPEEYKLIPLTKGKFAIVDNDKFDELKKYNWCYNSSNNTEYYNSKPISKSILKVYKGNIVDHINGDALDNRVNNLRICTQKDNLKNRKYWGKNWHQIYNGVMYNEYFKKWTSCIVIDGKMCFLSNHDTDIDAAIDFNNHAINISKYIRLNDV